MNPWSVSSFDSPRLKLQKRNFRDGLLCVAFSRMESRMQMPELHLPGAKRAARFLVAALMAFPSFAQTQGSHAGHAQTPEARTQQPVQQPPPKPMPQAGSYRSAFEDYRPFKVDEPLVDWRASNDKVRDIGGHIGLMKGSAGAGASAGHGGHGGGHGAKERAK